MANYQLGFIDIETVSQYPTFEEVPQRDDELYQKKFKHEFTDDVNVDIHYASKAVLYPEFGKIVCIVIGYLDQDEKLKLKTLCGRLEKPLLSEAGAILSKFQSLVGHNAKNFDYPYLCKRMMINGITIPQVLNIAGKKPWEITLEDTMEMWAYGQFKATCSLDLLAHCLGLPSPKQEISGADVGRIYWDMFKDVKGEELPFDAEEKAVKTIGNYCQRDVVTLVNVYRKLKGLLVVEEANIIYA